MKFDAEKLRREFGASDQKRDAGLTTPDNKIGRASCRERVCHYV